MESNNLNDGEINLNYFFRIILRNKNLISLITIFAGIVSLIHAFRRPKLWEGQFEIVLEKANTNLGNPALENLLALGGLTKSLGKSNSLDTEVAILESPMVLMPTFEFAKKEKEKVNPSNKNLIFSTWLNSLEFTLLEKTSVLNISYRDTDKDLIKPVLEKITIDYQKYSGEKKRRQIKLSKDYLTNQIDLYKNNSKKSLNQLQVYAYENDILVNFLPNKIDNNLSQKDYDESIKNFSFNLESNSGLESQRVLAANKMKVLNLQLEKIKNLDAENVQLEYISSIAPNLTNSSLINDLNDIESKIVLLNAKYTDQDLSILRLQESKKIMLDLLKQKTIGYLKAEKLTTESLMESVTRPKEVLLKYKELLREAERDEMTLVELENSLRITNLEGAKIEDPWQLITKPTLNKRPVGFPSRYILLIGLFSGFFLGAVLAIIKEKLSKVVFDKEELENKIEKDIIYVDLNRLNDNLILDKLFADFKSQSISIIQLSMDNQEDFDLFKTYVENKYSSNAIDFRNQIKEIDKKRLNIIFTTLGKVNESEINNLKEYLQYFEVPLLKIICT